MWAFEQQEPNESRNENQQRLGYLLDGEQQRQSYCGNERGRQVNHSPLAENESRTRDGPDGRGSDSMHKNPHLLVLGEAPIVGGSDEDEEVRGGKYGQRGHDGAQWAGDQITDKGGGDHDGPRRNHGDGDGIEELPFGEPVGLPNDSIVEERHNG